MRLLTDQIHAGSSLPTSVADAEVIIDGIVCSVATASATQLTCTTGPRPSNSTLGFTLASTSRGHAAVQVRKLAYRPAQQACSCEVLPLLTQVHGFQAS